MSFKEGEVKGLVTLVVNTARELHVYIEPGAEAQIVEYCRGAARETQILQSRRDIVVGAAGLVTGGLEMAKERNHVAVTAGDVEEGYRVVLRGGMEPTDRDMVCSIDITRCMSRTILLREHTLRDRFDSFRGLLDAVGEF